MNQIEKNTVSSKGQLKESEFVTFEHLDNTGLRVMFVGNSITKHGYRPAIGWYFTHGMAASAIEKDYVHLMEAAIQKKYPDAAFCIAQVASWEREFSDEKVLRLFEAARDFTPDVIVMRAVENCPQADPDQLLFEQKYGELIEFLRKNNPQAKVVVSTGFWHHVYDEAIRAYAAHAQVPLAELGDLGDDDSTKALDQFEHSGVANHPGDKGMRLIADRLLDALKQAGVL